MSNDNEPCGCNESLRLRAELEEARSASEAKTSEIRELLEQLRPLLYKPISDYDAATREATDAGLDW